MIRVDRAGELAANWIYSGQSAVLGTDPQVGKLIRVSAIQYNTEAFADAERTYTANVGAGEETPSHDGQTPAAT